MGDCWQVGKPSRCVTSHPDQLSLVIHLGWCKEYHQKLGCNQAHSVMHWLHISQAEGLGNGDQYSEDAVFCGSELINSVIQ